MRPISIIKTISKIARNFKSVNEPSSKNWGFVYTTFCHLYRSTTSILPELPIEDIQEITSFCKNLPFPGFNIQRITVPNQFREQAYQMLKSHLEQRYGFYPLPREHHWSLSKPLDVQWLTVNNRSSSNPKSAIYYIHGGDYVIGHSCLYNMMYKDLSQVSSSEILTIDYRLGPQYTLPSMIEDVFAAYFYLLAPITEGGRGFNSSQVVVGGESAGGGLSANLIHILRSAKLPTPAGAFLWTPSVDLTLTQPSYVENNKLDYLWDMINPPIILGNNGLTLDSGLYLWMYNKSSQDVKDRMIKDGTPLGPREGLVWREISPMLDPDMNNLPPTLIIVGERDSLRDFGIVYGRRRAEAEMKNQNRKSIIPNIQTIVYEDMVHAFMVFPLNKFSPHAVRSTGEFIYQALNANNQPKIRTKEYKYLTDYKKAYMNTTYNMYWKSIQSESRPWESPYKITPIPAAANWTTQGLGANGLP